ncbi:MAG: carbohydrate ABC transporter permease [Clostridiales bacterium]|nr:carbohydrate ABC transporter permease [Clostridiales bacterium]
MARAKNQNFSKGLNIHTRRTISYVVLSILSFFCLIWFYILFINATRSNSDLTTGFSLLPSNYAFKNWAGMRKSTSDFVRGMINSIFTSGCSAVLCVYFSTMTAYAIHAYDFKLKKALYTFILAVMMIPTQVTTLGFVTMLNQIGLVDSYIPIIIPSIAAPVSFFYMKQYMDSTLPLEIIEAARIDGSGEVRTFNSIILPIMKPAIAVQAIFTFVGSWNNYFTPALILTEEKKKTLPILIADLRSADFKKFDMGVVYMTIAFSIFPVIVIYLILSKNIVGGVAAGSVKG